MSEVDTEPSPGERAEPSRPPPAPVPRRSLRALAGLRSRIRRLAGVDGGVRIALVLVALLLGSFVADYFLVLPRGVRGVLLVASSFGLLWLVIRWVLAPLARRPGDAELALLVEEARPELRQRLITAVELTRAGSETGRHVSPSLVASVVAEAEGLCARIDGRDVLRLGSLRRKGFLLLLLSAAGLVGIFQAPSLAGIWCRRNVFLSLERWPRSTRLELWPPPPATVAMGDDLRVTVRVLAGAPRSAWIVWEVGSGVDRVGMARRSEASWDVFLGGAESEGRGERGESEGGVAAAREVLAAEGRLSQEASESLAAGQGRIARGLSSREAKSLEAELAKSASTVHREGHDVFVHDFVNVSDDFSFRVEAGDDRLGPVEVSVRLRPRIDMSSLVIRYRSPPYTGREDEVVEQHHGNLKVPVGTRVEYDMETNVPVRRAFFVLRETGEAGSSRAGSRSAESEATESKPAPWPDSGAVEVPIQDGKRLSGSFVVSSSGHYYFQFEDRNAFRSERPERFRIQAVPDRKPEVRILRPERLTEEVSPEARVRIAVGIKDDYGVRRAWIEGAYYAPGEDRPVRQTIRLPVEAASVREARAEIEVEHEMLLSSVDVGEGGAPSPGGRFEFWAVAEDFGETGQVDEEGRPLGQRAESQVVHLEIVDKTVLERILTDRLLAVRDQLRQILDRQTAVRKQLEAFADESDEAGGIDQERARALTRHRRDQERIAEGLRRQSEEMGRLLGKLDDNGVGDEDWKKWIGRIRSEVEDLATGPSHDAEEALRDLRRAAAEATVKAARIAPITAIQRRLERDLLGVVLRMEEFGDRSALIQLLRDARDRQKELRDRTREALGKDTGPERGAGSLPPAPERGSGSGAGTGGGSPEGAAGPERR